MSEQELLLSSFSSTSIYFSTRQIFKKIARSLISKGTSPWAYIKEEKTILQKNRYNDILMYHMTWGYTITLKAVRLTKAYFSFIYLGSLTESVVKFNLINVKHTDAQ